MMKKSKLHTSLLILAVAAAFAAASLAAAQGPKPFIGDWKGAISIMGQELQIVCHFSLDESGAIKGTLDSPGQGAIGLALGDIKVEAKKITFAIAGVPGDPRFSGELDAEGKKIAGAFTQSGMEGTFSLEKETKK